MSAASNAIGMGGAVLIRPDGFIAWRSNRMIEHPAEHIPKVFNRLLFVHYFGAYLKITNLISLLRNLLKSLRASFFKY
ncbi:hypothetical protein [Thalassobacillus devorans]|uniref:aromatic-ring hydroxylase C-terminal domain-containing protein n=1 Tax=Thalassobacillus devorans TaxID=279813 RepID=UPI003AF31F97